MLFRMHAPAVGHRVSRSNSSASSTTSNASSRSSSASYFQGDGNEDEEGTFSSTSSRNFTSANTTAAQSFELHMQQLQQSALTDGEDNRRQPATSTLLSPHFKLLPTCGSGVEEGSAGPVFPPQRQSGSSAEGQRRPMRDDGLGRPQGATTAVSNASSNIGDGLSAFGSGTAPFGLNGLHVDPTNLGLCLTETSKVGEEMSSTAGGGRVASNKDDRDDHGNDDDEDDDDYLAKLLRNIEQHAARLHTQFIRYPSSEVIKQQMLASAAAAPSLSSSPALEMNQSRVPAVGGAATPTIGLDGNVLQPTTSSVPSNSTGTKVFLGGLRYEVIQSGRHMVSWIFQVACGVHIPPSSILIHRKSRHGKANVAPTGCASVFVHDEMTLRTLLDMNQRIYCAEEGVYVSPSPETMKELIASKDVIDVTAGNVRGPTHPVVIERAYSVAPHHTAAAAAATAATSGGGAPGSNRATTSARATYPHTPGVQFGRSPSSVSMDSTRSGILGPAMPPPYKGGIAAESGSGGSPGGAFPAPQPPSLKQKKSQILQYSKPRFAPGAAGLGSGELCTGGSASALPPPPSYVNPGNGAAPFAVSPVSSYSLFSGTSLASGSGSVQNSPASLHMLPEGLLFGSNGGGPATAAAAATTLDPLRVTFHPYLRGKETASPAAAEMHRSSSRVNPSNAGHTILFIAALPTEASVDYVAWMFSLMAITLPPSSIHLMPAGGKVAANLPSISSSSGNSAPGTAAVPVSDQRMTTTDFGRDAYDSCATVSVADSDVYIALNFHHRIVCMPRGIWVGHSPQDIAALRANDLTLQDVPPLHIDRRLTAPSTAPAAAAAPPPPPTPHLPMQLWGIGDLSGGGGGVAAPPMLHAVGLHYSSAAPPPPCSSGGVPFDLCYHPPGAAAAAASSAVLPPPPYSQRVMIGERAYHIAPSVGPPSSPPASTASPAGHLTTGCGIDPPIFSTRPSVPHSSFS